MPGFHRIKHPTSNISSSKRNMIGRLICIASLAACSQLGSADQLRFGIFLQGTKIGQGSYSVTEASVDGKAVLKSEMETSMSAEMLGSKLTIEISSSSTSEPSGKPITMNFVTKSGGRSQTVTATFGATHADVVMSTGGSTQKKRLAIPTDGPVLDDPMALVLNGGADARQSFYVLRPDTISFVKNEAINRGKWKVTIGTASHDATLIEVIDPMATLRVFVSAKGDLIKMEGPLGIEMYPEGTEPISQPSGIAPDLGKASALRPEPPLPNPANFSRMKIRISGIELDRVPSDEYQTTTKVADGWTIVVHPPQISSSPGVTLAEASASMPQWVEPDSYIPSDSAKFKAVAAEVIGSEKRVRGAALKVQNWVANRMRADYGIGVLRDASEVMDSRDGVCRDAAILATTVLRAGGVPTRLASGLVGWNGAFYYHAWVEVWDGKRWLGIDPTVRAQQISASHVKLACGTVADAFKFPLLDRVSIKLELAERS